MRKSSNSWAILTIVLLVAATIFAVIGEIESCAKLGESCDIDDDCCEEKDFVDLTGAQPKASCTQSKVCCGAPGFSCTKDKDCCKFTTLPGLPTLKLGGCISIEARIGFSDPQPSESVLGVCMS